ncbi:MULTISPECIES: MarR family winged helix-turn-helix transcriptional regulator [Kocuria]|uniref:MarR family winged helix-turn-helix transcriptional regulator n=1 Tax=Kocuria TaxID=57493 RepID=UPI0020420EB1|nr:MULTISPECIES: MarR family transcriptional regulator [Kocuria]MCM3686751.1 MarR family transcriptional regulator [Kocuria rosea]HST73174.1 MarR family transcriptional regulator [Kocuria rosea]
MPRRETDRVQTSADAWEALYRAQVAVMRRLQRQPEFADLSAREYDVLFNLSRADEAGMRLNELNEYVLLTQSSLSRMLERLELKGLVHRWQDPQDLRGLRIRLTEKGRAMQLEIAEQFRLHVHELMTAGLDQEELLILTRLAERLRDAVTSL